MLVPRYQLRQVSGFNGFGNWAALVDWGTMESETVPSALLDHHTVIFCSLSFLYCSGQRLD